MSGDEEECQCLVALHLELLQPVQRSQQHGPQRGGAYKGRRDQGGGVQVRREKMLVLLF